MSFLSRFRRRSADEPTLEDEAVLRVLTDHATGDQLLVCRDDEKTCRDRAAQRQVHLDRAVFEEFGLEPPRPTLRVVR